MSARPSILLTFLRFQFRSLSSCWNVQYLKISKWMFTEAIMLCWLLLATLNVLKSRWIGVKLQCTSSNFLLPQTDQSINYLCIYRSIFHLFYFHPFLPSLSADILLQARAIHLGNCILYYIIIIIMCYIFSLFSAAGQYGPGCANKVSNECTVNYNYTFVYSNILCSSFC